MDGIRTYKTEEIIGKGNVLRAYEETKNTAVGLHTHEFIEIVYVRSGKAVETVDGKQYSVHPGENYLPIRAILLFLLSVSNIS